MRAFISASLSPGFVSTLSHVHLIRFTFLIGSGLAWLGSATSLCAQEERRQLIQEAFQSSLVYPQEEKEVQLTLMPSFVSGDEFDLYSVALGIEYGFTDAWQMEVEWAGWQRRKVSGIPSTSGAGDLSLGTQYSWMNLRDSDFHLAAAFEVSLPVGNLEDGFTEGFIEYEPQIAAALDLSNDIHLFTQLGVGLVDRVRESGSSEEEEEEEPEAHELEWNIGLVVPFGDLRFVGEFNLRDNSWNNEGTETELYVTPGLVWDIPGTLEMGLGFPIGITDETDRYSGILIFIYEFELSDED